MIGKSGDMEFKKKAKDLLSRVSYLVQLTSIVHNLEALQIRKTSNTVRCEAIGTSVHSPLLYANERIRLNLFPTCTYYMNDEWSFAKLLITPFPPNVIV